MNADKRLSQAYDKEQETISEQLNQLRRALGAHKSRFKDNGNFGDVGNLNDVSRSLAEILEFVQGLNRN